jgi:hypothetical protein
MLRSSIPLGLAAALAVAVLAGPPVQAAPGDVARSEREVGSLEALITQARFREASVQAPSVRARALALPPSDDTRRLVIRSELAAGTAALALGQESAAQQCFERALRLDPELRLPDSAPPKLRRSFEAVRGRVQ